MTCASLNLACGLAHCLNFSFFLPVPLIRACLKHVLGLGKEKKEASILDVFVVCRLVSCVGKRNEKRRKEGEYDRIGFEVLI